MLQRITQRRHMMRGQQGFIFKVQEQMKGHVAFAVCGFEQHGKNTTRQQLSRKNPHAEGYWSVVP